MNDEEVFKRTGMVDQDRYSPTTLFNVYTAQKIADYVTENKMDVVVNATNPGFTKALLFRNVLGYSGVMGWFMNLMGMVIGRKPKDGSRNLCHAGFGCAEETHRQYLSACRVMPPRRFAKDTEEGNALRNKVWNEIGKVLVPLDSDLKRYFK